MKFKNFFKNNKIQILAFFVPMLIFGIGCIFSKVWPFGENYIVSYDGSAQYPGFTTYLMNVLKGNDSLFYSFKGALGYNFYATAIYYLFNPTNLLSVFFNKDNVMVFYTLISFLRIGLCGLTMSIYLKKKEKESRGILLFSIAYALMAYNVTYFYNFMYFDTVVFFPLVILGLDKLINGKSSLIYIIFLTISIISNFYIGSMVCIFCLLYFIYKFIIFKKCRNKKVVLNFIVSSLLAGLMCAFVLMPEFFELMSGKASLYGQEYTVYNEWGWDAFASFYRLSIGSYAQGDQVNGYPNIYCSVLVLVYTTLFFFNKKYSAKEKIVTGIFFAFFLLCFSYNLLDYAWEFFQKPVWYPNRYSFVFSFLLITIAYKSFNNVDAINIKTPYLVSLTALIVGLVLSSAVLCEVYDKNNMVKLIFLLLSVICIIEYMFTCKMKVLPIMLASIFLLEITANTVSTMKFIPHAKKVGEYETTFNELDDSFEYIEKIDPSKNNFYRADANNWTNINSGGSHDYNAMIYFNSLRNGKMMYFLEHYANYGMQDQCSVRFDARNPIMTSLLGFKYMALSESDIYYKLINGDLKYKIYENEDSLSLAMMMNKRIKDLTLVDDKVYINSDNIMNYSLSSNLKALEVLNYTSVEGYTEGFENEKKYVYYNSKDGGYILFTGIADKDFFLLTNNELKDISVNATINDTDTHTSVNLKKYSPFLINKGDKYEIKMYMSVSKLLAEDVKFYLLDYDIYKSWINEMKKNELEIIKYEKDNYIKGKITVAKDKTTMFTSIPYDRGWRVFVDGKKINYTILLDSFIGVDLMVGEHTIEFKYIPRGFIIGTIISLTSLGITIIYLKKRKPIMKNS